MSEEKRPLKVFLCHAHVDKNAARSLYNRLTQDGVDAWLDKEKLLGGANWEFEIRKAVRECDIFVVCVSQQFTQRLRRKNFAQTEVGIALNEAELKPKEQIYIIPVRLENCAVPKSLQTWHWVDLFEPDGYQRLICSLNKRIEELHETEAAKGQAGQGNISVVVSGQVGGNVIVGNDNTTGNPNPQPKAKKPDEKALALFDTLVPFPLIQDVRLQDFGGYPYARVEFLYKFLERAAEPALIFLNPKIERDKQRFVKYTQEFCDALLNLTETTNPHIQAKMIIYDPVSDPQRHKEATDTLHNLADKVYYSYQDLQRTAKEQIFGDAIGDNHATRQYLNKTLAASTKKMPEPTSKTESNSWKPEHKVAFTVSIIGAAATLLAALIGVLPQFFSPVPVPTPTNTQTLTAHETFTPTLTRLPTEITDPKGVTMRLVPAGEFRMGSDSRDNDEKPAHIVDLDDFYIDIYEVTNVRYKACVETGVCTLPQSTRSDTRENYYGSPEFDNYPVIYVNWNQANTYCKWRGTRLPTEAEWEKAARSTDQRIYPWGSEGVEKRFANYGGFVGDTSEVGVYPAGISPYGLYDMAGNVWEWVADWYALYPNGSLENPTGPESGQYRVLRGGSWGYYGGGVLLVSDRDWYSPVDANSDIGFRCLRSP